MADAAVNFLMKYIRITQLKHAGLKSQSQMGFLPLEKDAMDVVCRLMRAFHCTAISPLPSEPVV